MAIRARIADKPVEVINYQVSEDATPLDPGSMEGGYGEIHLNALTEDGDFFLRDEPVSLQDSERGRTSGTAEEVSVNNQELTVIADSVLGMLNSWHHIPVVNGTIEDLVREWFAAAEIDLPIEFQDGIGDRPIVSPAHYDNLWDRFKMLMSAQQIEAALVNNVVVLREPRKFEAYTNRQISPQWTVGQGDTAEFVEIKYYTTQYFDKQEFYPILLANEDLPIMQVDTTENAEYAIEMNVTLDVWPENPIRVETFVPNEPVGYSVYSVVGNDDLPIPAKMWNDYGGRLWVEPHEEDPHIIVVRIQGAGLPHLAPFRIAMSSGAGNYYNSLRLVGSGVVVEEHMLTLRTGASRNTTGSKIGITVENPYVTSLSQAYDTGLKTAAAYSGLRAEIAGEVLNINRRNEHEPVVVLSTVDRELSNQNIQTISDFNSVYDGHTLSTLSAEWDELAEEFAVQAFGNAAGARIHMNDSYYRITSANFNIATMDYNAVIDNTLADFSNVWEGATLADVSKQWEGHTLANFSVAPLRRN